MLVRQHVHHDESTTRGEHSRHAPGSGLGLTIARVVMELHGGSIGISNSGAGTVVVEMTLPQSRT